MGNDGILIKAWRAFWARVGNLADAVTIAPHWLQRLAESAIASLGTYAMTTAEFFQSLGWYGYILGFMALVVLCEVALAYRPRRLAPYRELPVPLEANASQATVMEHGLISSAGFGLQINIKLEEVRQASLRGEQAFAVIYRRNALPIIADALDGLKPLCSNEYFKQNMKYADEYRRSETYGELMMAANQTIQNTILGMLDLSLLDQDVLKQLTEAKNKN